MSMFSQLKRAAGLASDDVVRDEMVNGVRTIEFPPAEIHGGTARPGDPDYVDPSSTSMHSPATAPILSPAPEPRYPSGEEPQVINLPATTIYGSQSGAGDIDPDVAQAAAAAADFASSAWDWTR